MSVCQIEEMNKGGAYPRSCPTCGLSPICAKGLWHPSLKKSNLQPPAHGPEQAMARALCAAIIKLDDQSISNPMERAINSIMAGIEHLQAAGWKLTRID